MIDTTSIADCKLGFSKTFFLVRKDKGYFIITQIRGNTCRLRNSAEKILHSKKNGREINLEVHVEVVVDEINFKGLIKWK